MDGGWFVIAPILFISQGSSCSCTPAAAATRFPSSINACRRCPRPDKCVSSAKWGECGNPVSAAEAYDSYLLLAPNYAATEEVRARAARLRAQSRPIPTLRR